MNLLAKTTPSKSDKKSLLISLLTLHWASVTQIRNNRTEWNSDASIYLGDYERERERERERPYGSAILSRFPMEASIKAFH